MCTCGSSINPWGKFLLNEFASLQQMALWSTLSSRPWRKGRCETLPETLLKANIYLKKLKIDCCVLNGSREQGKSPANEGHSSPQTRYQNCEWGRFGHSGRCDLSVECNCKSPLSLLYLKQKNHPDEPRRPSELCWTIYRCFRQLNIWVIHFA